MTKRIGLFVYERTNFLTLTGLLESFATLSDIQKDRSNIYDVHVCSAGGGDISGRYGCFIKSEPIANFAPPWDTFIVCGGWGFDQALKSPQIIRDVAEQSRNARRVCVIGGGAFIAAAAGLLDDHRVAAHPIVADRLAQQFPKLRIDKKSLLLRDANLFTSPGMSSSVDLALTMIEADFGYRAAIEVAKYLVVPVKRSFNDPQVSDDLILQEKSDRFGPLHDWVRSNLKRRLSIEELAERTAMSVRNFTRVYQTEMGISPRRAVEIIRVYAACRMLMSSKEHVKGVASRCGFGSERTFLRSFTRIVEMSPNAFRAEALARSGMDDADLPADALKIELNVLLAKARTGGVKGSELEKYENRPRHR